MEIKADELAQLLKLAGVQAQPEMDPMPAEAPATVDLPVMDVEMPGDEGPCFDDQEAEVIMREEGQYTFTMDAEDGQHEISLDQEGLDDLLKYVSEPIGNGAFVDHDGRVVQATNDAAKDAVDSRFGDYMDMMLNFSVNEEDEDPAQGDMELDNGYTGSHEVALDKTNDNPSGDDKDEFTMDEPKGYRAVKMENCEETKAIHESLVSKYADFLAEQEEMEEGRGGAMARAGQKMKMDKDKGRSLDHSSEEFKALAAMYQKKAKERDAEKAQVFGEAGEVHGAIYTADQQEMLSYLANFIGEMFGTGEETDDIALHVLDELPYETLEDMENADYDGSLADEVQYHVEAYQSGPDPEDVAYQADQQAWDDSAEMDELRGLAGI